MKYLFGESPLQPSLIDSELTLPAPKHGNVVSPIVVGCQGPWNGSTGGSWPSLPGLLLLTAFSTCWGAPGGTRMPFVTTYSNMSWNTWPIPKGSLSWMKPVFSKKGINPQVCNVSTAERPHGLRTAKSVF